MSEPVLDEHELPDTCPTCGQEYEQVFTTTGRYSAKPEDSGAVIIHVVRNMLPERGWDFGIFVHERGVLDNDG